MPHNEIKLELVNLSLLSAQVGGGGWGGGGDEGMAKS